MREYLKKALRRLPLLAATLSAAALIVAMPSVSAAGVKKGLLICASSAVPSLYPFCVLSAFFVRSGLCGYLGKFLEKPVRVLFALPGSAGAAACMSFVAGYPVGVGMTAALFSDGRISQSDAQRMTLFCVNAGPAFVIGGVGAGMLGSVRAGVIIFVSLTLASLALGVLTRFIPHNKTDAHAAPAISGLPLSRALTEAVADGTKNMISKKKISYYQQFKRVCLGCFFYATLCADSRSRHARMPWLVRSSDIFCPAVASSAQA